MHDFADIQCPYCGEWITVAVDPSVEHQQYTEDCQVCCRPMVLTAMVDDDGEVTVVARSEDDS